MFKIPNTGRILLFGHTEILHLLIGMDGAALAAAVPCYSGKATWINSRNEVLKKLIVFLNNTDLMPVLLHRIHTSNTRWWLLHFILEGLVNYGWVRCTPWLAGVDSVDACVGWVDTRCVVLLNYGWVRLYSMLGWNGLSRRRCGLSYSLCVYRLVNYGLVRCTPWIAGVDPVDACVRWVDSVYQCMLGWSDSIDACVGRVGGGGGRLGGRRQGGCRLVYWTRGCATAGEEAEFPNGFCPKLLIGQSACSNRKCIQWWKMSFDPPPPPCVYWDR